MTSIGMSLNSKTSAGSSNQSSKASASTLSSQQSKASAISETAKSKASSSTKLSTQSLNSQIFTVNKDAVSVSLETSKDSSSQSQGKKSMEVSSMANVESNPDSMNKNPVTVPSSYGETQDEPCEKPQGTSEVKESTKTDIACNVAGTSTEKKYDQTASSKESIKCEKLQDTNGVKVYANIESTPKITGTSTEKKCDQTAISKESENLESFSTNKKESGNKGSDNSGYVHTNI